MDKETKTANSIKNSPAIHKTTQPEPADLNDELTSKFDVKCQKCGEKRKTTWKPGMLCPVCGSKSFMPMIKVDSFDNKKESIEATKTIEKEKKLNIKLNIKNSDLKRYAGIAIGVILVIVWAKIGWIFLQKKFKPSSESSNLYWEYLCGNCNNNFLSKPQIPPVTCPSCKKKTSNIFFVCLDCKFKFPLIDKSKSPICPKCTSKRIIAFRHNIKTNKKQE